MAFVLPAPSLDIRIYSLGNLAYGVVVTQTNTVF